MSTVTSYRQTDNAWKMLFLSTKNGVILPFSLGDTVGWNECYHREFVNVGKVIRIRPPYVTGSGGYCTIDGTYHLLGSTEIKDFEIEVEPKHRSHEHHVSTSFKGTSIHNLRSARVVLIEKIKKPDIYNNK